MGYMGVALTSWADVEEAHFLAFRKMMGSTKKEICSIIYFSIPSFEAKRVLVDRVATYYLADEFKKGWSKLDRELQQASAQRGMLAHSRPSSRHAPYGRIAGERVLLPGAAMSLFICSNSLMPSAARPLKCKGRADRSTTILVLTRLAAMRFRFR